jgi:hypothetical protein
MIHSNFNLLLLKKEKHQNSITDIKSNRKTLNLNLNIIK